MVLSCWQCWVQICYFFASGSQQLQKLKPSKVLVTAPLKVTNQMVKQNTFSYLTQNTNSTGSLYLGRSWSSTRLSSRNQFWLLLEKMKPQIWLNVSDQRGTGIHDYKYIQALTDELMKSDLNKDPVQMLNFSSARPNTYSRRTNS